MEPSTETDLLVAANGVRLASQSFGAREHPALVLVMGATASMLGWPEDLCRALADRGLFVIRFDHRDTGRSTTLPPGVAGYCAEDMAEDVLAVADAYGLATFHLAGMSLGGYLAQMAAQRHPTRIQTLTLIASEPLGWDGDALPGISPSILDHFAGLAALDWSAPDDVTDFLVETDRLCAGSGQPFDAALARQRARAVLARTDSIASMFNHTTLEVCDDWTGMYRRITQPVLVIHGDEDPVLPPENGAAIAASLPGSRTLTLAGAGHELRPPDFARIADAIREHVSASATYAAT